MADNEMPCYHMRRRYPFSNGWRCADCSYEQEYVAGEERAEDTMTDMGINYARELKQKQEAAKQELYQQGEQQHNSILREAEKVIYGDREKTYGAPDKNLQVIADMWNAYLGRANIVGSMHRAITTDDVCAMMILLKVARLKNDPTHHDSQVDICGYAALIERVQEYRKRDVQNSQANSQKVNNAKP
jgi:hypothetical protein